MKKLLVAILGIFMVLGSCLLSACENDSAYLTLSSERVSVEVRSDQPGSDEVIVTAEVSGAPLYRLEASANGYDEFLTVATEKVSETKTNIIIKGVSENDTPSVVTVKVAPGNIEQHIYVDVFSQIKTMSQNFDSEAIKNNYLVRGQASLLNVNNLLKVEPVKARKEITWDFAEEYTGVTLDGNYISVSETFEGNEIKLKATASNGVTAPEDIVLPVIDKIAENVSFKWSYDQNSAFELIEEGNDNFVIVSNVSTDDNYDGFVAVDYAGGFNIAGYAVDKNGNQTDLIVVNRNGEYNGMPLFRVFAMQGRANLNGEFTIGFKISHPTYNYYFDTIEQNPIHISAREKVNNITITDSQPIPANIEGTTQTLYTNYVDASSSTSYGPEYHVSITPTTVIDASNKYAIIVTFTQAPVAPISNGCPVEFWYRDLINGNRWTQIVMSEKDGNFVVAEDNFPSATTIYMKASDSLAQQSVDGIEVIFQSVDNPIISTHFNVKLVKSVALENFVFEDGDFRIDSSENNGNVVRKKQFTIEGQTSIQGLYIISESKNVIFSEIQYISNDATSVTFEVALSLKKSSYGVTALDKYQIAHRNGLTSEEMNIDIFLPLKDVSVRHNSGENLSGSVTDEKYDAKTYLINGAETSSSAVGLSRLMLKNDTTTPISYSFNKVNNYSADAQISVGFFDFNETAGFDLDAFKALTSTKDSLTHLIADALANGNSKSGVAYFTNDNSSIITKGVGYTYAVLFFKGKAVENIDEEGNTTLVRVILIESYISPNSINIVPDKDKNVTLYSVDSLSSSDAQLTRKTINIRFANSNITYHEMGNLELISRSPLMGKQSPNGNTITWKDGRYALSNVSISDSGISFNIEVIGTFGELAFYDTLDVHYVLKNDEGEKVYDIYAPISIAIKNAQRIERLIWKNADENGLYFEVGDVKPQYIMLETSPTNARNNNVHFVRTQSTGKFIDRNDDFVSITDEISANTLAVNLSSQIKAGMTGFVYLLPSDAVYNNQIKYYYIDENETDEKAKEKQGTISDSMLGQYMDSANKVTYYDFLVSKAYFKSNASESDEVKNISFANILIKIKVVVADGSSFEHAYRIFDNTSYMTMKPELYYTVMTSLDLTGETYEKIGTFTGGLQGVNEETTIKLDGQGFASTIAKNAEVRNIKFIGSVQGDGFVSSDNYGKITNVAIDVDGINPSVLSTRNIYGGGITGTNYGEITSSSVLGLNIISSATVGGIAGRNFGKINLCKVEFYNLAVAGRENEYAVNTFVGSVAGALVGVIENGSSIKNTFAYNYGLTTSTDQVLVGGMVGAFAGAVADGVTATDTVIDYSFAVINITSPFSGYNAAKPVVNLTNYYLGYLTSDNKLSISYSTGYLSDPDFVAEGKEGFKEYVNEGQPHLKNLIQDERVKSVDYNVATTKNANGYYKSVAVSVEEGQKAQGIVFFYAVDSQTNTLNSNETNDLNKLNTISLAQLVGEEEVNKNIIITSSNSTVVKVVGSSLKILKTGKVTLTLSSKQNVEINRVIEVTVAYSMSEMQISWINASGRVNYVYDNSILTLQKTRSRDFMVGYEKSSIYLGATTTPYTLKTNDVSLDIVAIVEEGETAVAFEATSKSSFKITASDIASLTQFAVAPKVFKDATLQKAISDAFVREFSLQPVDGVISFGVSGEILALTPSTTMPVKVEIKTTDENDGLVPQITFKGEKLKFTLEDGIYTYMLPRDVKEGNGILNAYVQEISRDKNEEVYTITYSVLFSVDKDYEANISENMDFEVYFESNSGNSSKDWNGKFTLALTRQKFTNVDVQIIKVANSQFLRDGDNNVVEVHNTDRKVAVLAPGNTAIMQVNINPAFAYFDYVEFSYGFGEEIVLDAVNIEVVQPFGNSGNQFTRRAVDGNIQSFGTSLRYTPTASEKARGVIYFKVWINTTVQKDSRITFTATFKEASGAVLSSVRSYLTVSYLTQPKVTVDGSDTAYIALGSTAKVQIDVLADQVVDTVSVDGSGIKGVYISALSEPEIDEVKGIKTYYATLSASILAVADNDTFAIQAQVSRELNGSKEYKTTVATVVLVDFKISEDKIKITGENDGTFTVWQGVPKTLNVEYTLLPENYNVGSDEASQKKLKQLNDAREFFLMEEYYPAVANVSNEKYFINYCYDKDGNILTDEDGKPKYETLEDRLFYVIGNEFRSINDTSIESPVDFTYEDGKMTVVGLASTGEIQLVLRTYVSAGGVTTTYDKYFTIVLDTYSDPDLPIIISDATEFKALNPQGLTNIKQNDYILENDIVLENYTPFDTSLIRSFDGNGFTIYIKSFNTTLDSSTLNLALFRNVVNHTIEGKDVPTTLKNIRVNLYNGGQITVNTAKYKTINIAGLAIENNGIITNCEVVSFFNDDYAIGEAGINYKAGTAHANKTGINVSYVDGVNTTEKVYHDGNVDWDSQIAGFVITNNGSITNSRVGGDTVITVGTEKLVDGKPSGYTYATEQQLYIFNIVGQGNMSGFVLSNSGGYIASSFAKNIDMENESNSTSFYTAGFVGINTSSVITSYVEGVESDEKTFVGDSYSAFAREGSSIKSKMGYITGFTFNNTGTINDSYSNILIANSNQSHKVYLASGFVYTNEGTVENCYSASQIQNSNYTQMNFSGVSATGDLLTTGNYTNCYFFNKAYESYEDLNDNTTEATYSTGAVLITKPTDPIYFYGFAIADGENDGIWRIDKEKGITLIEPNIISVSHRYVYYVNEDYEGITAEDDDGKYTLLYSTLTFLGSSREINTSLGGASNPILIIDAQNWVDVTGLSESKNIKAYFNSNSIWGTYRLVNNIDLSTIASSDKTVVLPSSQKAFSGSLYGNGFEISGISMSSGVTNMAFGLFASIESRGEDSPKVTNVNLKVDQVIAGDTAMVGALAGYIKDSYIINIEISLNENSNIGGLNFVGSLAGLAFGNNMIKNIVVDNPSTIANRYQADIENDYFTAEGLKGFRTNLKNNLTYNATAESKFFTSISNYSYAGGVIGFVDNYSFEAREFDFTQKDKEGSYSINNVRVTGTTKIQGQVTGGAFGLLGYQTNIRDVGLFVEGTTNVNSSYILSTKYFAGGIAGQSFGSINRTFASHDKTTQELIEDNMSSYYGGNTSVERGILNLFYVSTTNYTQQAIGGLVGYVGSGNIDISYSKLNVTSPTADYAGGLIGIADLIDANPYQADSQLALSQAFTKFFLNEIYTTGDVRGRAFAGGIIGAIKGEGSRVAMLSVNALNYLTTYDYSTGEYLPVNETDDCLDNLNFKLLVGACFDDDNNIEDVRGSSWTKYIKPMKAAVESAVSEDTTELASIAVFEQYSFAVADNKRPYLIGDEIEIDTWRGEKSVYVISGPSLYANSSVGHTYTQEGFLNSGVWSYSNWTHAMAELYPEIKYKESAEILYLDCFNVEDIFKKMSNSNYRVIIRGLESEGSEESKHINLDEYFKANMGWTEGTPYPVCIENFSGILQGGIYRNVAGERIKIIASQTFIKNTGPGFIAEGVTVEYVSSSTSSDPYTLTPVDGYAGFFINSTVSDATLSNIELIINRPVIVDYSGTSDLYIGLVAPKIVNTSVTNVKIKTTLSDEALLSVVNSDHASSLYAGLIAGEAQQRSSISMMQINGIELVDFNANLIALSETNFDNYYVGGFIGKAIAEESAQELRIGVSQIAKKSESDKAAKMQFTDIKESELANVGGYIGFAEGVSLVVIDDSERIANNIAFDFSGEEIGDLNVGGLFGKSKSKLTMYGQDSTLTHSFDIENPVTNLSVGGLIGLNEQTFDFSNLQTSTQTVTITKEVDGLLSVGGLVGANQGDLELNNVDTATLEVTTSETVNNCHFGGIVGKTGHNSFVCGKIAHINAALEAEDTQTNLYAGGVVGWSGAGCEISGIENVNLSAYDHADGEALDTTDNQSNFNADYDAMQRILVSGEAHVGIIAGRATGGQFKFSADADGTKLNEGKNNNPIKLINTSTAGEINFGSVLGSTNSVTTSENSVAITGKITSKAQVTVASVEGVATSLGGIVGKIEGQSESGDGDSTIQIGGVGSKIRFDGAFYTNCKTLNAGGMIGLYTSPAKVTLSIQNTSFGGAVKIYGENSNESSIVFGGTIANTSLPTDSSITIQNNYNYGDIFVEYDENLKTITPTSYVFGGIIGNATGSGYTIGGNYSLTTSHNARQDSTNATVNALFGSGIASTGSKDNYYNHAVSLCTDYYGVDAGYVAAYSKEKLGFNGESDCDSSSIVTSTAIKDWLEERFEEGHKLQPASVSLSPSTSYSLNYNGFNGIRYCTLSGAVDNASIHEDEGDDKYTLTNIALIGSGNTISYQSTSEENTGFIRELAGFSWISGIVFDVDVKVEDANSDTNYGSVVGTMSGNSVAYAVQAQGKIEVGGSDKASVSGLVGKLASGRIFDCSTELDIVYRAGEKGTAYGLTYTEDDEIDSSMRIVDYSYVNGSIKTMINSNVYAFTNGTDATINECYCVPKIDWNDYTVAEEDYDSNVKVIDDDITETLYYEKDALDSGDKITISGGEKQDYSAFQNMSGRWTVSNDFNFGYPTLKYGYLKRSSYSTRDEGTAQGESGLDAKIISYTYRRLANGSTPEDTDFYMIPNKSVLNNMINIEGTVGDETTEITKKFALLYDIDGLGASENASKTFSGIFDGREKTISGLKTSLFSSVSGEVRNLRLTDAALSGNTHKSLLAKTIFGGTVSNITLSGTISVDSLTYNSELDADSAENDINSAVGALAVMTSNTRIDTITNLVKIDVNLGGSATAETINIGGIVGFLSLGTTIEYCSNYGPINVNGKENNILNVGGIAGKIVNGTSILYSYNATSVTAGYATSSSMSTTVGTYKVGGLVGCADGAITISNSYNSGMIKAGNKSNTSTAYAGGIIGYGRDDALNDITISTCYNEGPVEALGKNPEFVWAWELTSGDYWWREGEVPDDGAGLILTLRQSNECERNVYAYGIGYVCGGTLSNNHVRVATNIDDDTIYNNGTYAAKDSLLKYWTWDEISNQLTTLESAPGAHTGIVVYNYTILVLAHYSRGRYLNISYHIKPVIPSKLQQEENVTVTAVDELGIPTAFILTLDTDIEIKLDYRFRNSMSWAWDSGKEWFNSSDSTRVGVTNGSTSKEENFTARYLEASQDYYNCAFGEEDILGNSNSSKINKVYSGDIAGTTNTIDTNPKSEIVENTRSQQVDAGADSIMVGGATYYLADKNNLNSIFNAGIYQHRDTVTLDLPWLGSQSYYSITTTLGGVELNSNILNVCQSESGGLDVEYVATSSSPIVGELNVSVKAFYEEQIIFDSSNIKYVYNDDYSIKIEGLSFRADYKTGTLTDAEGKSYDSIFVISTERWGNDVDGNSFNESGEQPLENDPTLTYLAHVDTDGDETRDAYLYIPNAYLGGQLVNIGSGANGNLTEGDDSKTKAENFVENIKKITSYLGGKTFYSRSVSEESKFEKIDVSRFSDSKGIGTLEFNVKGSQDVSGTIEYGKEVNVAVSSVIAETQVIDGKTYDNTYTITLNNPSENVIGLNETTPYFAFNGTTWSKEGSVTTVTIGSRVFDIETQVNGFKLTAQEAIEVGEQTVLENVTKLNDEKTAIESFFKTTIKYIANDWKSVTIDDKFATIQDSGSQQTEFLGNTFTVNYSTTKTWKVNTTDKNDMFKNNTGKTIDVVVNAENASSLGLASYSLGGVIVYKGRVDYSLTQSYEKLITRYICQTKGGVDAYWEITTSGDEWSGMKQVCSNHNGGSITFTGDPSAVTFNCKVFSTYKLDEDDLGSFKLVVTDGSTQYLLEGQVDWRMPSFIESEDGYDYYSNAVVKKVSQVFKDGSNEYLISQVVVDGKVAVDNDDDGNPDGEEDRQYVSYCVGDNAFLTVVKGNGGVISVTTNYDDKGQVIETYDESGNLLEGIGKTVSYEEADEDVYLPGSGTLKLNDLINMTAFNSLKNSVYAIKSETLTYLALAHELEIMDALTINEGKESKEQKLESSIKRALYDWNNFNMPIYNPIEKQYLFDNGLFVDENLTVLYNGEDAVQNYLVHDSDNKKFGIVLNIEKEYALSLKYDKTAEAEDSSSSSETASPSPIILTNDISFKDIAGGFEKVSEVNIIGNDYYISYYGASFYQTATDGFIRDVKFLGETYGQALLVSDNITTNLYNIDLYGSANNVSVALIDGAPLGDPIIINGLRTVVSIQGELSIDSPVTLFDIKTSGETNITNCGLIVAYRGANGESGSNGYDAANKNGGAGGAGTNGAGIKASTSGSITVDNKGILNSGNGGNGGAGGSSYSQDELNGMTACDPGKAGAGGVAGGKGELSGFTGNTSVAADGLSGVKGAKARGAFKLKINMYKSYDSLSPFDSRAWSWIWGQIDELANYCGSVGDFSIDPRKEYATAGGSDKNINNIISIFNATASQELPKDVWGN